MESDDLTVPEWASATPGQRPMPVPTPAEAQAALVQLDASQRRMIEALPGRLRTAASTLTWYAAGVAVVLVLTDDRHPKRHETLIALVVVLLALAALAGWRWSVLDDRLGISSQRRRVPRAGGLRYNPLEASGAYPIALIGVETHSALIGFTVLVVSLAVDGLVNLLSRPGRTFRPKALRPKPDTFYREFLDPDVWRLSGAMAVVSRARPGALAHELDIDRTRVDGAIDTLARLGYLTGTGKDDGRGILTGLNGFGLKAFRHQLAAYENAAAAPSARVLATH